MRGFAVATLAATWAVACHGHPVVTEWNKLITDSIVKEKINTNAGTRILATTHVAQWEAVKEVLKAKGVVVDDAHGAPRVDASVLPELQAAVAGAGKSVLWSLLPNATDAINALHDKQVGDKAEVKDALDRGQATGAWWLSERANDGSSPDPPPFKGLNTTGKWRSTPPAYLPALTPQWKTLKPWALDSPDQLRLGPPPALASDAYKECYEEVKAIGGKNSTVRTPEQTDIAVFWSGNIEVLWSTVVEKVTANLSLPESARYFAVASVAGADARIAAWDSKYLYLAWRPVTAIPLGNSVGYDADPSWQTVFPTPNHPEYPMGHSTTGEAYATVLKGLTGNDEYDLVLTSYTLPGKTRTFKSFSEANKENTESRILGGVHYRHSGDASYVLGRKVGEKVLQHFGLPVAQQQQQQQQQQQEPQQQQQQDTIRNLRAAGN